MSRLNELYEVVIRSRKNGVDPVLLIMTTGFWDELKLEETVSFVLDTLMQQDFANEARDFYMKYGVLYRGKLFGIPFVIFDVPIKWIVGLDPAYFQS